jgi:NACalpha-BTF3-like transcription factor
MGQAGVSYEAAKKALQENEGNPAEAIISLMG